MKLKTVLTLIFIGLITLTLIGPANAIGELDYLGNNSLRYDGIDDYVSCSSSAYRSEALTIELWIRPNYTIEAGSNANYGHTLGAIICNTATWVGSDTNQGGWALYFNFSDGHLNFRYRGYHPYYNSGPVTVETNRAVWYSNSWYHIAVTFSSGSGLAFYVNKVVDKTTPPDIWAMSHDTSELQLGGYSNSGYMFNGLIDEVQLWNVSRTSTEISNSWDRILNETECSNPNLVSYWRFDEGTGTESKDFSVQNNNANLASAPYDPSWNDFGAPIIVEFPSFLILPIFMIVALLAIIAFRRKRVKQV
jgi:hypothetical protein